MDGSYAAPKQAIKRIQRFPGATSSIVLLTRLVLQPMEWAVAGCLGSLVIVALVVLRIYLGWSYVGDRLLSASVAYEETGWYALQTKSADEASKGPSRQSSISNKDNGLLIGIQS